MVCGGRSAEHEISILSAQTVVSELVRQGFPVRLLGIASDGGTMTREALSDHFSELPDSVEMPAVSNWIDYLGSLSSEVVVFPVLHGPYGEDGTVQGLLELLGLPYVGSGIGASAVGMNKIYTKRILKSEGIPILPFLTVDYSSWQERSAESLSQIGDAFPPPWFVKPSSMGSSIGITRVDDSADLGAALEIAFAYDDTVVVEQGIEAREIEVSVLGNLQLRVSVPGEIVPGDRFYSYRAKYLDRGSELLVPAPLSESQVQQVQSLALSCYRYLQLEGMARVDLLMDRETEELWVNEPNTIPGFTHISMYPRLWEASGLSCGQLLAELIELAEERNRRRARLAVQVENP